MNLKLIFGIALALSLTYSCENESKISANATVDAAINENSRTFGYNVEQFSDIKILRY